MKWEIGQTMQAIINKCVMWRDYADHDEKVGQNGHALVTSSWLWVPMFGRSGTDHTNGQVLVYNWRQNWLSAWLQLWALTTFIDVTPCMKWQKIIAGTNVMQGNWGRVCQKSFVYNQCIVLPCSTWGSYLYRYAKAPNSTVTFPISHHHYGYAPLETVFLSVVIK